MWQTLREQDVQTRLAGPEISAFKTTALASGQTNPLPEILSQVTAEVRGYVAACSRNSLDTDATKIPGKLIAAAADVAAYRLLTRLPVGVNDARKDAMRRATQLLEQVAACKFAIDTTDDPASNETAAGGSVEVVSSRPNRTSSHQLKGL